VEEEGQSEELKSVALRIETWRRTRSRLGPMPVELWAAAGAAARRVGITHAAKALGLGYYRLREHATDARRPARKVRSSAAVGDFIEILAPEVLPSWRTRAGSEGATIAMVARDGTKVTVSLPPTQLVDFRAILGSLRAP
jgi:hypothetical protein